MKNRFPESSVLKNPPEAGSPVVVAPGKRYTAAGGSLQYTFRGLLVLFFWLLWGDFAYTFFESIFSRFIPLYLRNLHASNSLIGIMTGSIAGGVNILFLPNISQWSDNHRSRLGRRIPFIYVVTPLAVASLVAVGFAPEIAGWFQAVVLVHLASSVSATTVVLGIFCGFAVSFHFFNMVLVNTYNWLLRDVVPEALMAQFLSWFRIVGAISGVLFFWYLYPCIVDYRKEVFLGVGIFYLATFLVMCLNVKEGHYPPPTPAADRPGILKSFALYFRECLSIPIYRNFFLVYVLTLWPFSCAAPFGTLFLRETLHTSMDEMGKIYSVGLAVSVLAYYPIGWLCDKFSPVSVTFIALVLQVFGSVFGYFFATSTLNYFVIGLIFTAPTVAWSLGFLAAIMKLFPEQKFGQFSSGLNVFGCGGLILGNYLVGAYMDAVHSHYRMFYIWNITFFLVAIIPMALVYRDWKRLGGRNYVPPLPGDPVENSTSGASRQQQL